MTEIPGGSFTASGPFQTTTIYQPQQYLAIGPHVRISLDDGSLEYGPDYQPDEAARAFWEAMSSTYSNAIAANKRIRAFLEDMAGWSFPRDIYAQRGLEVLDGADGVAAPATQASATECTCAPPGMIAEWHLGFCARRKEQQ